MQKLLNSSYVGQLPLYNTKKSLNFPFIGPLVRLGDFSGYSNTFRDSGLKYSGFRFQIPDLPSHLNAYYG